MPWKGNWKIKKIENFKIKISTSRNFCCSGESGNAYPVLDWLPGRPAVRLSRIVLLAYLLELHIPHPAAGCFETIHLSAAVAREFHMTEVPGISGKGIPR
jgi:hypothetical protein